MFHGIRVEIKNILSNIVCYTHARLQFLIFSFTLNLVVRLDMKVKVWLILDLFKVIL